MSTLLDTREEQASACLKEAVALRPQLLGYARKLTNGDDEAARDLVQEATLRLHESVQKKGPPAGPLNRFLCTVIRNVHYDAQRHTGRHQSIDSGSFENDELLEHHALLQLAQAEAPEAAVRAQRLLMADRAAAELQSRFEPHQRIAFRLSAEEFSVRDIGEMMGRSASAVSRSLCQVRHHLQIFLRPMLT